MKTCIDQTFIPAEQLEWAAIDFMRWEDLLSVGWAPPTNGLGEIEDDHVCVLATNADAMCEDLGHVLVDCGYAGPESGCMDHECSRCGQYWSCPLY